MKGAASKSDPSHTGVADVNVAQPDRLLRLPEVLARIPVSRPAWYRAIRHGLAPKPTKLLGSRASAWSAREIDAWIERRLSARDGGSA